jgi:hypothetical protein
VLRIWRASRAVCIPSINMRRSALSASKDVTCLSDVPHSEYTADGALQRWEGVCGFFQCEEGGGDNVGEGTGGARGRVLMLELNGWGGGLPTP